MTSKDAEDRCYGYLRKSHNAIPVVYLVYPDGTKQGLCRVCGNRWLLSEEEWGLPLPENRRNWIEGKTNNPPNEDK